MREIAAHAARADAEPDHRDEDEQRQRGVGLEMRGRRLDARHERRPVGDEDEGEQRADEGAIGAGSTRIVSRIWLSTVSTISSKAAWVADGTSDRRRVTRRPPRTSTSHDRPGGDHACGDRHRTEMEERDAGERRVHGAASRTLRMTTGPGDRERRAPSPAAAARLPGSPTSAGRQEGRSGRSPGRWSSSTRPPAANRRAFHQTAAKIEQAERDPGGEMRGEAERH